MGGSSFQDLLDDAKANDSMEVDTSFLDEFRRTGAGTPPPAEGAAYDEPTFDVAEPPIEDATLAGQAAGPPASEPVADKPAPERAAHDGLEAVGAGSPTNHGGSPRRSSSSGSGGTSAPLPDPQQPAATSPRSDGTDTSGPRPEIGAPQELDAVLDAEDERNLDQLAESAMSAHRKTDQQDAIQAATGTRGGGSGTAESLPESGFRIIGLASQPMVRNLPRPLVDALRLQLRSAAIRERGVSDKVAEAFSRRLSQGALVTAFLLAQLDVRMETDPATQAAVELFRSQDPLLGSIAGRIDTLEQLEHQHTTQLERLHAMATAIQRTSAVIEQSVAYSIADRTVNFLRGSHNIHDAPITHQDAIYIRDRARDETRKRSKFEDDRDGRPIR
ncbi:hypothetical protein GCM10029976_066880 [Kribbella albertanoniae]|uniref:Uncharacterized protein n=1 Tax=Kribbella albertanoniae TaxID=1266829 RepID=A0A4R4QKL8_9ACTN|nr:hypothetical protein [Kribbella albertanoniae]TDC35802.1 hypothetical protein E1261_00290 [Kribbella albertanoniae]